MASPVLLGAGLLIFLTIAWGVFDLIGSSGTTSAAFVVSALLILVPAALAAWRGQSAIEYAQQVFEQTEGTFGPPPTTTGIPRQVPPGGGQ